MTAPQTGSAWINTPREQIGSNAHKSRWNEPSTTPDPAGAPRVIRITHPFHPLFGREYALVTYRKNWGEDRIYFHNDAGQLISLPAGWTDFFPADLFQVIAASQAHFRPTDLALLVQLIEKLRSGSDSSTKPGNGAGK